MSPTAVPSPNYRWLTVAPPEQTELVISPALPQDPRAQAQLGQQGTWVLESDNIQTDYDLLKSRGVKLHTEVQHNNWRSNFLFEDLYGNTYDVVQPPKD